MRILYFTRDYTPHDYRFLTALAEQGDEVFFLRLERGSRQMEDRSLPPAVKQVLWRGGQRAFRWRDLPALYFGLREVLQRVKPDIVHAGPLQTAAFLAALSGFSPLVSMSWGSDLLRDANKDAWYRWVTRTTLRRSTVLVGDCKAVRDCARSYGLPDDRIFTFPWGIDLDRFASASTSAQSPQSIHGSQLLRDRLGWQDAFVVLSLRSWEPVYGIDVLLRGFAQAAEQAPELRLLMMGGGSQAGLVHQMIQQHDLADRVYLGGQVSQNDLPKIYQAADLYISASHSDGSSVSLMESLGCGLPVLLSDIPSNREWVSSGDQGWFFPDGDHGALANILLQAVQNRADLPKMGQAARRQAEKRADWNQNFQVLRHAYSAAAEMILKSQKGSL